MLYASCQGGGMADAAALKSAGENHAGSTPVLDTIRINFPEPRVRSTCAGFLSAIVSMTSPASIIHLKNELLLYILN